MPTESELFYTLMVHSLNQVLWERQMKIVK